MSENKFIGVLVQDSDQLVCFNCAYENEIEGLVFTQGAYPDGFTCDKCFEPKFDQDYIPEAAK